MPTPRHHRLPKVPAIPSDCFYVKLCSNHRDPLFPAATDRGALNEIMIDELLRFDAQLHAYCWLTHHLHALLEVDAGVLSRFIRRIATRYSQHRHSLSQTREHLFERPYQARRVTTADDFLALLRFIHLSPVQTMLAVDAADYPWSSHRAYLNDDCYSWVTTEIGLGLFANDVDCARATYRHFIALGLSADVGRSSRSDAACPQSHDRFAARLHSLLSRTKPWR